jgi:hypothetical protein
VLPCVGSGLPCKEPYRLPVRLIDPHYLIQTGGPNTTNEEWKEKERRRKYEIPAPTLREPIKTENRPTARRLKIASVALSVYCLFLYEVNSLNQNYFSRPHENETFLSLPYCREIKLRRLKKKSYILIYIVRGCNLRLGGLQPLSSCHARFRNATLALRP